MNEQSTRSFRAAGRETYFERDRPGFDGVTRMRPSPLKLDKTVAFMVETRFPQQLTRYAAAWPALQVRYPDGWRSRHSHVDPALPVWNGE